MRILILGPPGAGKGTQARSISNNYGITHVSTGKLIEELALRGDARGIEAMEFCKGGGLLDDKRINSLVEQRLSYDDCKKGFILDGFPRTVGQYEFLSEILSKSSGKLDAMIYLDIAFEQMLVDRLSSRRECGKCNEIYDREYSAEKCICGGGLYKRYNDPSVIEKRLKTYNNQTSPLIEMLQGDPRLLTIGGEDSRENVYREINSFLINIMQKRKA